MNAVIKYTDCSIICGYRGEKKQTEAYLNGYSKLQFPESKHNKKPSRAVDVIPYPTGYKNPDKFKDLAIVVRKEAELLNIELVWGGHFIKFKDVPHWQLK